ncbi:hypothetical protein ADK87_35245 [Streptomyces sp. NRRL F-4711]|nr:hypothetical protein ADK87_35245 [Streptomyces sp. NRRL F-4711]
MHSYGALGQAIVRRRALASKPVKLIGQRLNLLLQASSEFLCLLLLLLSSRQFGLSLALLLLSTRHFAPSCLQRLTVSFSFAETVTVPAQDADSLTQLVDHAEENPNKSRRILHGLPQVSCLLQGTSQPFVRVELLSMNAGQLASRCRLQ